MSVPGPRTSTALTLLTLALAAATPIAGCSSCEEAPEKCTGPADCMAGELCAMDGRCVPGAECVSDAECVAKDPRRECDLAAFTCVLREGFGDECDSRRPCAFGQFCSELLGRCFDADSSRSCTRRGQCPSEQICDRQANKCIPDVGCWGEGFCEDGELCDLVDHVCRTVSVECVSCFSSGTCAAPAECTNETKECLAPGVTGECRTGERCDPLGRCVQCTTSTDCGPGLFCNVALGRCESNTQCAEDPSLCPDTPDVTCVTCTAPEVCDARTRKCQAPAMICANDVECPGDQYCDVSLDPPVCQPRIPDCLNDRFEDTRNNNRFFDATPLDPAQGPLYGELALCPGDADWYHLVVPAGTYLTIDARFHQADGDIDLQLYLPDGATLLDESRSSNDNERVELAAGTDRELLLRVFLAIPSINPVPYSLVIARDPGEVCPDDANEPDDSAGDARALASDSPYEGRLCSADPDWFVIRAVPSKTRINAILDHVDNLGNLDLELYRAGATTPLLSSASSGDVERVSYDASYGGDYFLRVVGRAADTNVYTLRVELRESDLEACLDDFLEPNDVPGTAADGASHLDTTLQLSMCRGDEDWYAIDLGPGEVLTAEAGFRPGADLELRLYPGTVGDPRVAPLRQSTGTSPREHLAYRTSQAGNYLLRVHGHDPDQVSPYELRLGREPPFVTCPPDLADQMMRGTSIMDAWDLTLAPTRLDELTLCAGDEDYYRVLLQGGFTNVIRVQYVEADANLDMALFNAGGQQLVQTAGTGFDAKEIAVNVNGAGVAVVFLRVFRAAGFETRYNLTVDLVPIFNCFEDFAEPNETPAAPSLVASSTVTPIELHNLTLCPSAPNPFSGGGDEDYFEIVPPSAPIRIHASIEFQQGDLLLELLDPTGLERACLNIGGERCYSDGFELTEEVTFTATVARPYYLHVGSVYSSPNVQVRPPEADTPYTLRLEYTTP